jgi:predicted transcriptional regulator
MKRTQIQLTEDQADKLREIAMKNHESVSSLIRSAIDQFLSVSTKGDRTTLYQRAEAVVGKYSADADDVSVAHDRYLEEEYDPK